MTLPPVMKAEPVRCPHCHGTGLLPPANVEQRLALVLEWMAKPNGRTSSKRMPGRAGRDLYRGDRTRSWYLTCTPSSEAPWLPMSEAEVLMLVERGLVVQTYPGLSNNECLSLPGNEVRRP